MSCFECENGRRSTRCVFATVVWTVTVYIDWGTTARLQEQTMAAISDKVDTALLATTPSSSPYDLGHFIENTC